MRDLIHFWWSSCTSMCKTCRAYCKYDKGHVGSHRCNQEHTW